MANVDKMAGKTVGGNQWARVIGTPTPADELACQNANKAVIGQPAFKSACEAAGIKTTKRQASKWNNQKGVAYNLSHRIEMNGFRPPAVA